MVLEASLADLRRVGGEGEVVLDDSPADIPGVDEFCIPSRVALVILSPGETVDDWRWVWVVLDREVEVGLFRGEIEVVSLPLRRCDRVPSSRGKREASSVVFSNCSSSK